MKCHMWTVWLEASSVFSLAFWSCCEVLLGKPRPIPREPCTVSSELRPGRLLNLLPKAIRLLFLFVASCWPGMGNSPGGGPPIIDFLLTLSTATISSPRVVCSSNWLTLSGLETTEPRLELLTFSLLELTISRVGASSPGHLSPWSSHWGWG